ncbi:cytochrome c biogenesis CcdA family protein [Notoacmeibacter sp. MSK16QG-6]|uniref:cytochrome c biogenesis CcdA family protein n=1 Tax=Notoacmeibacter sp. MSK16QG-6 TaxID=2957982 RepID=UPI00209E2414|nr:cytochrome c biogenesis CcdA family protein [Notoacmeibacter sp. MSK16QG-6]MCP1200727.1 cytochrome c biogenesis CcdA family protein [Notoacmeibacter sp. MSK16QG-6]
MAIDVGYATALGAGALSFLSPCVLPLVPPYLCYMAGVSVEEFRGGPAIPEGSSEPTRRVAPRRALFIAAVAFVLGFSTVFVLLGVGASTIGRFLRTWQEPLAVVAGLLIILMGLNFLGIIRIPLLSREARINHSGRPANSFAAYLMGLAFAFGWTPCIGPVLGSILTMAAGRSTAGEGAIMLAVYSLGLGIPFLIAAFFSGAFMRFLQRFRLQMGRVEKVMGGLLVLAGIAFLTGGIQYTANLLLETFPGFATIG